MSLAYKYVNLKEPYNQDIKEQVTTKPKGATNLKKNLGIAKMSQQLNISTKNLEQNSD